MNQISCTIIGGGPAGLAVAGRLAQQGISARLLEKGPVPGWSWVNHYDRLRLHTIKAYSHLPGMAFPAEYPQYVPKDLFAKYLQDYARKFDLNPEVNTEVNSIKRVSEGWEVSTKQSRFISRYLVIATGYNRVPIMPVYDGLDNYQGIIMHSKSYKTGLDFKGKRVLVVGMGNTGAEIALDLLEQGAAPEISIRNPVNIIPRDFFGRPAQKTAILLNKLPEKLRDHLGNILQRLAIGDLSPYGIPSPKYAPTYQVRNYARIPVIDLGTVKAIKEGKIKVNKGIASFHSKSVRFTDGKSQQFEAVVFATGYHAGVPSFFPEIAPYLNNKGQPEQISYTALSNLFFIGFAAPSTGILRSICQDSETIAAELIKATKASHLATT